MQMKRMLPMFIGLCLILASPAVFAQEKRVEVNGTVGYSFSNGIDVSPQDWEGQTIDRLSPTSAFSFDLGMDVFLTEGWALGFNFGQQQGKLRGRVRAGEDVDFTDMNINNYHGLFTYNFGDEDSEMRPYIFGGLGATQYAPSDIEGNAISSRTRFSTTWGGGVKFWPSDNFGFKGGVRWTPTYITTTPGGTWCSPLWPWNCWVVGNDHFSHQFEFVGGIVARF
jgi:opacity protein-like surface antigen